MTTNIATTNRADLELAILEHDILATDADGLNAIQRMTTDELRNAVRGWIHAGDETADC